MDPLERLTRLVREQRGALLAVARGEGMRPEEALECVQQALLTFLMRDDEQHGQHAAFTLLAMVRNEARNARRKHARRKEQHTLAQHEPEAPDGDAEALLLHAEEVVRLRLCVAKLCDIQRAVVTLRLLDERSGEDVASELGLSRSYVDVLVHRARASLHVCMRAG